MSLLTQAAYARRRKVSRAYVCKLIRFGMIPESALRKKGKRVFIVVEEADKALRENLDPLAKHPEG